MTSATIRGWATLALGVVAAVMAKPCPAPAQGTPYVTVALVRRLPDTTASATIIRTSTRTLLLLREDADAATLATAMASVYRATARVLDRPDQKLVVTLHGQRRLASLAPNERQLGDHYLSALHRAKPEALADVGTARFTHIPLEPRRMALR